MEWAIWQELTDKEKETFQNIFHKFLNQTFILENQFNFRRRNMESNPDYRFIDTHLTLFHEFLNVAGWNLENDVYNGVYFLKSKIAKEYEKLDKNTTLVFLVLRLLYEEKKTSASLDKNISVSMEEFYEKVEELQIGALQSLGQVDLTKSFIKLRKFMIVEKTKTDFIDKDNLLILYPSITHLLDNGALTDILEEFKEPEENEANEADELEEENTREDLNQNAFN